MARTILSRHDIRTYNKLQKGIYPYCSIYGKWMKNIMEIEGESINDHFLHLNSEPIHKYDWNIRCTEKQSCSLLKKCQWWQFPLLGGKWAS